MKLILYLIFTAVELSVLAAWLVFDIQGASNLFRGFLVLASICALCVFSDKLIQESAEKPEPEKWRVGLSSLTGLVVLCSLLWCGEFVWSALATWCWACGQYRFEATEKLRNREKAGAAPSAAN